MDRMEKKSERELEAIRKLLRQGMRWLAELNESQKELIKSQKETDRLLRSFIKSLRNGGTFGNGRSFH
jgi:hypothetical protein